MQALVRTSRRATYADYLAVARDSPHRHELIDGIIVAMAGGSDEHNAIAGQVAGLFATRRQPECRYYTPDQRFWIAANGRARYSDGSLLCGKPDHPPHDGQATLNPVVVLEVLSPSTEGDDQGDKRIDFQSLASLRAYVLASQDQRRIAIWRRDSAGGWPLEPEVYGDGASFVLPAVRDPVTVDEVYAGILDAEGRSLLR